MTLQKLNAISTNRKRIAESFRSLISTRNTIIDSFDKEYQRHVKLTSKKENPKEALKLSLSKSRNIKKIQKEFLDNKNRIKENQLEAKMLKKTFQEARRVYEENLISNKQEADYA
jgi:hypothetical protein